MNFGFMYFLGGLVGIGFIILAFYWYRMFTKEQESQSNPEILVNLMPSYAQEHGLGIVNNKETSEDRTKIDFSPRDIDYLKNDKDFVIKNQKIITKNYCYIPLGNSGHRKISLVLPPKGEDLPQELKSHPIAPYLISYIEHQAHKEEFTGILRKRLIKQKKILEQTEGLDIVRDYIEKSNEVTKDAQKRLIIERKEEEKEKDE